MQSSTSKMTLFWGDFSQVYLNRKKLKLFKRQREISAVEINCHIHQILDLSLALYTKQE